jgi:hypothetical protein
MHSFVVIHKTWYSVCDVSCIVCVSACVYRLFHNASVTSVYCQLARLVVTIDCWHYLHVLIIVACRT